MKGRRRRRRREEGTGCGDLENDHMVHPDVNYYIWTIDIRHSTSRPRVSSSVGGCSEMPSATALMKARLSFPIS
jgi:hypothetical protein